MDTNVARFTDRIACTIKKPSKLIWVSIQANKARGGLSRLIRGVTGSLAGSPIYGTPTVMMSSSELYDRNWTLNHKSGRNTKKRYVIMLQNGLYLFCHLSHKACRFFCCLSGRSTKFAIVTVLGKGRVLGGQTCPTFRGRGPSPRNFWDLLSTLIRFDPRATKFGTITHIGRGACFHGGQTHPILGGGRPSH